MQAIWAAEMSFRGQSTVRQRTTCSKPQGKKNNEKIRRTKGEEPFLKRTYNGEVSKPICLKHTHQKIYFLYTLGNSVTFFWVVSVTTSFCVAATNAF